MRRAALAAVAALALAGCAGSAPPVPPSTIVEQAPPPAVLTGRGVAWYRSDAAWERFWSAYDGAAADRDLAAARQLGFDTVRIFIQPDAIGYPQPRPAALRDIDDLLARARRRGLRVDVALFDRFGRYDDAAGSARHLRALLPHLVRSRALAFVEPRNEIDPADPQALAWLRSTIRLARAIAPAVDLVASTPGRAGPAGVARASRALGADQPDAWAIHWYGEPSRLPGVIAQVRAAVAPTPVLVGEVGYATTPGNGALRGTPDATWAQEAMQVQVLALAARATRDAGLPPPTIWQLNDLRPDAIPPDNGAAGDPVEQSYGLRRVDGTPKPSAVAQAALTAGDDAVPLDGGFEAGGPVAGGDLPALWRLEGERVASFARDGAVHRSGAFSARIANAGRGPDGRAPAYFQSLPALPGHRYRLEAWARAQGNDGDVRLSIGFYAVDGTFLAQSSSRSLARGTTRDWRLLAAAAYAPARTASVRISLGAAEMGGSVWFDDVEVVW